jgi:UDP-glucuronate 4-epimerase
MNNIFCILGDCNIEECHYCFPVKNCSFNHEWCNKNGFCDEIDITKKILVTGCAGFIGFHTCKFLLENNYIVYGIDNMNDYYDLSIKNNNIKLLKKYNKFKFYQEDIQDTKIISKYCPYKIIHLASIAGVRYSIQNPKIYCDVNIKGFIHLLEESVKNNVQHLVYASSSSVYGLNEKIPFQEDDKIEMCNSPYACSKMAMELYAKMYTQLYNISCIGLRFFTVYGPHGRPDMAPYKFMKAIMNGEKFDKYGNGTTSRDYTYIDDIVSGIIAALKNKNKKKCEIYNLGNSQPVTLNKFIEICENICQKKAIFNIKNEQLGDVPHTYASIEKAQEDLDYNPKTNLKDGLQKLYDYLKNNNEYI